MQLIQFSPEEKYLVTFSSVEPSNPRDPTTLILNIFDVKTGAKLRNFQVTPEDVFIHPGGLATNWPIFKWAGGCNDKYAAPCRPIRASRPSLILKAEFLDLEQVYDSKPRPAAAMQYCLLHWAMRIGRGLFANVRTA